MSEDLRIRLLIVDDEQSIRQLCMTVGEALGFICMEADSGEAALALLEEQPAHMILTDMVMPNMSGLEFLEKVKKLLPRTEVAVMTGHGSVETAVQAMKLGAYDYISKPFSPLEELRLFLRRMAEKVHLVEENQFLRERVDTETELHGIVGSSAKIQDVLRMISRLKDTRTPVLITGESGTGKELVARAIHFRGSLCQPSVRGRRLRIARPNSDRERTVRLRKRRVHRRPADPRQDCSSPPTAAPSSSTKSANCRSRCKPSCCAFCRKKKSVRSAAIRKSKSMCASIAATNRDLEAEYATAPSAKISTSA